METYASLGGGRFAYLLSARHEVGHLSAAETELRAVNGMNSGRCSNRTVERESENQRNSHFGGRNDYPVKCNERQQERIIRPQIGAFVQCDPHPILMVLVAAPSSPFAMRKL